jgi:hypothetical protein
MRAITQRHSFTKRSPWPRKKRMIGSALTVAALLAEAAPSARGATSGQWQGPRHMQPP